ncbi:cytochrome P450 CYP82D47-like [Cucumis melo var. makuwa]|uniref:Cytochrome P450 CYP82D47-like n=1 Tax=Cucumis melo var. makuwa TaxID=1194695 RepID=A0A5D3CBZ3_CUCMM|nr:cytochrome P450 CYP82D47-like [Cucumis melo var. makuwa]TYK08754.1 cytochrome P450 CYP82D47-like [Cucumis melo var. makuwa]
MMVMNNCHIKADQAMMNDRDESHIISSFPSCFEEKDALFLEFGDERSIMRKDCPRWTTALSSLFCRIIIKIDT